MIEKKEQISGFLGEKRTAEIVSFYINKRRYNCRRRNLSEGFWRFFFFSKCHSILKFLYLCRRIPLSRHITERAQPALAWAYFLNIMKKQRVIVYVDGFNFYYGLKNTSRWKRYYAKWRFLEHLYDE